MPNPIPKKTRQNVYERADYRCELCGSIDRLSIHHIIPRRHKNHEEEALIFLCGRCHDEAELKRKEKSLHQQLKTGLQKLYQTYYGEEKAKRLLGGKFYIGEVTRSDVKNHFKKIERRYFQCLSG